jgi:hypothetical protein
MTRVLKAADFIQPWYRGEKSAIAGKKAAFSAVSGKSRFRQTRAVGGSRAREAPLLLNPERCAKENEIPRAASPASESLSGHQAM